MNKDNFIVVDYNKCVGCGTCEMVCSLSHDDICSPALSRMRVVRQEREGYNVPITCSTCEKPACLNVCPVGAISRNKETDMIEIDAYRCIGCRQCVRACPFGHMNYNFERRWLSSVICVVEIHNVLNFVGLKLLNISLWMKCLAKRDLKQQ